MTSETGLAGKHVGYGMLTSRYKCRPTKALAFLLEVETATLQLSTSCELPITGFVPSVAPSSLPAADSTKTPAHLVRCQREARHSHCALAVEIHIPRLGALPRASSALRRISAREGSQGLRHWHHRAHDVHRRNRPPPIGESGTHGVLIQHPLQETLGHSAA